MADIIAKQLKMRDISIEHEGYSIYLEQNETMDNESFIIEDAQNGVKIISGGQLGLIHGAGWFLRNTSFFECGAEPYKWRGEQHPKSKIRGMYFASHFHNYYHVASLEEMQNYMESLALWGVNYIMLCYPLINIESMDNPEATAELNRHADLINIAHSIGLKCCEILSTNMEFKNFPVEFKAAKNNDAL